MRAEKDLVSVVIPTHNSKLFIERAVSSVIMQTYKNVEVVIVDDGSIDNTEEVLRGIVKADRRVRVFLQEKAGVSSARNRGIEEALGQYILFLDSDDYLEINAISCLIDKISKGEHNLAVCGYRKILEKSRRSRDFPLNLKKQILTGEETLSLIFNRKMAVFTGTALFRRDIIDKFNIRFTVGCINGQDNEFYWKVILRCNSVVHDNSVLFNYFQRENSVVNNSTISKFHSLGAKLRFFKHLTQNSQNHDLHMLFKSKVLKPAYVELVLFFSRTSFSKEKLLEIVVNASYREHLKEIELTEAGVRKFTAARALHLSPKLTIDFFGFVKNLSNRLHSMGRLRGKKTK